MNDETSHKIPVFYCVYGHMGHTGTMHQKMGLPDSRLRDEVRPRWDCNAIIRLGVLVKSAWNGRNALKSALRAPRAPNSLHTPVLVGFSGALRLRLLVLSTEWSGS